MAAVEHFKNDCAGCHGAPNSAHEDATNVILYPNAPGHRCQTAIYAA
jgi:hypothetical protein